MTAARAQHIGGTEIPPGVRAEKIEPLWRRVDRNRVKFVALTLAYIVSVAGFFTVIAVLIALALPFLSGNPYAALTGLAYARIVARVVFVVAAGACAIWVAVQMARSERSLLARLDARRSPQGEDLATKGALKDMAIAAGFEHAPQLHVIDTANVNALALGRSPDRAVIGVTRGFIDKLSADDQRAVFANLMARIVSLDTLWATAVSALAGPIWALKEYEFRAQERPVLHVNGREVTRDEVLLATGRARLGAPPLLGWVFLYGAVVVVTELLAWWHQESAWGAAEKADAEGMLLLKDPRAMLDALQHVLDRNNHVPTAGDAYSQLFFCWSGFGFAPEDDPEYRRIWRLKEVLGTEGMVHRPRPNVPAWPGPPAAPVAEAAAAARTPELPAPRPVATEVSRGPDGRIVLLAVTALAALALDAVLVIGWRELTSSAGLLTPAATVLLLAVLPGVAWAGYLLAAQRSGPAEAVMWLLAAFGVFCVLTLGYGILAVLAWAAAAALGVSLGAGAARREWRVGLAAVVSPEVAATGVASPVAGAAEASGSVTAAARVFVRCRWCGAGNAPLNRQCIVCGKALKP